MGNRHRCPRGLSAPNAGPAAYLRGRRRGRGRLVVCSLLASMVLLGAAPAIAAPSGYVMYTRASKWAGEGKLRLVRLENGKVGATIEIDDDVKAAQFAPDGKALAYVRHNGSSTEIVHANFDRQNLKVSNKTVLKSGLGTTYWPGLCWRMPGKILFVHDHKKTAWTLDVASKEDAPFYTSPQELYNASVSTDGTHVVFYSRTIKRGIWKVEKKGGSWGAEVHVDGGCGNWISPDGKKFTNNLGSHQDMLIRNWDTSEYKSLSIKSTGEYWNSLRWSNNSNRYILYPRGKDYQLPNYSNVWVMDIGTDVDPAVQTRITSGTNVHDYHRDFWVEPSGTTPVISLGPAPSTFQATEGGADPPTQKVQVTNSGGGTLGQLTAQHSANWLVVSGGDGGDSQTLTNKVSLLGLSPGTYSTTVTVSGGGATNTKSYKVTLEVKEKPVLTKIVVAPAAATIAPAGQQKLTAALLDQHDEPMSATIGWSVSDGGTLTDATPAGATFKSDATIGTFTITAKSGAITGTAKVTVQAGVTNLAPQVEVGSDLQIDEGDVALLEATVSDDGLPAGTLTLQWSRVSGPGVVIFFDADAAQTQASFSAPGVYVVKLVASDTALEGSATIKVTVAPVAEPSITVVQPNGGEVWEPGSVQHIRWTTVRIGDVSIEYSIDDGQSFELVTGSIDDAVDGWLDYEWTVPGEAADRVIIRISDYLDSGRYDESDGSFVIAQPSVDSSQILRGGCSLPGRGRPALLIWVVAAALIALGMGRRSRRS
jgi:hypothetical protein